MFRLPTVVDGCGSALVLYDGAFALRTYLPRIGPDLLVVGVAVDLLQHELQVVSRRGARARASSTSPLGSCSTTVIERREAEGAVPSGIKHVFVPHFVDA